MAGDIIIIEPGSYGDQTITAVKTSPGCTVIGDPAGVTLNSITPNGAWFEIQKVNVTTSVSFQDVGSGLPNHITLRNVNAGQPSFWDGGDSISWIGGTIGPYALLPSTYNGCFNMQGIPNNLTNVTLDGVTLSGCTRSAARISAGDHTEVIRLNDGINGLTIKNSTFNNEDVNSACIFAGSAGGRAPEQNITLENNYFGSGCNKWVDANLASASSASCINWLFDYNTSTATSPGSLNGCTASGSTMRGNLSFTSI